MITSQWSPLDPDLAAFLDDFDQRSEQSDGSATELFADTFLALDPGQAMALTPSMLAAGLSARRGMFAAAGVGAVHRVDARQLRLDEAHALVAVHWDAERADREPLRLESTFLVRREPDGHRIMVYLNHRDIVSALAT